MTSDQQFCQTGVPQQTCLFTNPVPLKSNCNGKDIHNQQCDILLHSSVHQESSTICQDVVSQHVSLLYWLERGCLMVPVWWWKQNGVNASLLKVMSLVRGKLVHLCLADIEGYRLLSNFCPSSLPWSRCTGSREFSASQRGRQGCFFCAITSPTVFVLPQSCLAVQHSPT